MTGILPGTPRYFAWLYSDARLQALLTPLFGIETEINAALQPGLEHSVAHVRMTWWAEEAQRLRAGHALHPLTRAPSVRSTAPGPDGFQKWRPPGPRRRPPPARTHPVLSTLRLAPVATAPAAHA